MTVGGERFVELYESHYTNVYRYCRRRTTADEVDDAVAETFLTAWRKIDELPEGEGTLPWLYAVAYRVLGHQWRKVSRQERLRGKLAGLGFAGVTPPEEYVVVNDESRQILEALSGLRAKNRELLRLQTWEEMSSSEIASMFGISSAAVQKRLSRARKALADEYDRLDRRRNKAPAAQKGGAW
jgi:RNA polymerase sigma factor (sigma-70 family)